MHTKLSSVQRSLHCASPTFVSIVFYLSTLPLHLIVHNLAIIASDFCAPTAFPMFIFSSWAYCIFYVWSFCRQASYLYIKQRYNPSNIYISQPCQHMNLLNGVGGITVPSINRLWSPVWRLSACLESGIIYNILFNMQNPSKILLKLKLGNSKVLQITS